MASQKSAFMLFLLFSCMYAVDMSFHSTVPAWYFNTDVELNVGLIMAADPDYVIDGDPGNLQEGDTICTGATITAWPGYMSKWAVSKLDVAGGWPLCGDDVCPGMISYSTINKNRNIVWLSPDVFDSQNVFGDANDFSRDINNYNTLGTFEIQRVTYDQFGRMENKEGGANVFCKGKLRLLDGDTDKGGSPWEMPAAFPGGLPSFTVTTAGNHQIHAKLSGMQCFAAMVKHPLSLDNPRLFWLNYYTRGQAGPDDVTKTIKINVQGSAGTCDMHEVSVESDGPVSEDMIKIKVRMHNDATNAIKVTGVKSSNSDFTAVALNKATCKALGISAFCPDSESGGFNESIAGGGNKDLYVLVSKKSGASGDMMLQFQAKAAGAACGGASTCSEDVPIEDGPMTCSLLPSPASMATNVSQDFTVKCKDLAGDPISCVGSDWVWASLSGGFEKKGNKGATAYTTSASGSGRLLYKSGLAECSARIEVLGPTNCKIAPASDDLGSGMGRRFTVSCTDKNNKALSCVGSNWFWADGLEGDFIAKNDKRADAYVTSEVGATGTLRYASGNAACKSDITVIKAPYECELAPSSAKLNYNEVQPFSFNCWKDGSPTSPDKSDYSLMDGLDGSLSGKSDSGVTYTAPGTDTEGDLRGVGWFDEYFVPSFAHITVGNGSTKKCDTALDPDCDHNDDGSSDWCTIGGQGALSVFPGTSWVGIKCGKPPNKQCPSSLKWKPLDPELGRLFSSDNNGTYFTINGKPGQSGRIVAEVAPGQDCYKPFVIMERECWQDS